MKKDKKILILMICIIFMCFPLSAGIWEVELEPYQEYLNLGYEIVDIKVDGLGSLGLLKKEKSILAIMNDYRDPTTYTVHNLTNFFSLYDAEDFEFEPIWGDFQSDFIIPVSLLGSDNNTKNILLIEINENGNTNLVDEVASQYRSNIQILNSNYSAIDYFSMTVLTSEGILHFYIDPWNEIIKHNIFPFLDHTSRKLKREDIIIKQKPDLVEVLIPFDDYVQFLSFTNNTEISREMKIICADIDAIKFFSAIRSNSQIEHSIILFEENKLRLLQTNLPAEELLIDQYSDIAIMHSPTDVFLLGFGNEVSIHKILIEPFLHLEYGYSMPLSGELQEIFFLDYGTIAGVTFESWFVIKYDEFEEAFVQKTGNYSEYQKTARYSIAGMDEKDLSIDGIPISLLSLPKNTEHYRFFNYLGFYNNTYVFLDGTMLHAVDPIHDKETIPIVSLLKKNKLRVLVLFNDKIRIIGL